MILSIALSAILTVTQGGEAVRYQTEHQYCDVLLRTLSAEMPDVDLRCVPTSMRPIARPADLMAAKDVS